MPGFWGHHWDFFELDVDDLHDADRLSAEGPEAERVGKATFDTGSAWPAFRLPMQDGHELQIIYSHLDDDGVPGVSECAAEFRFAHPGWDGTALFAAISGNAIGPGLRWPEAVAIADRSPRRGATTDDAEETGPTTVRDRHLRLLLLLPAIGDLEAPAVEARERIAEALVAVGLSAETAPLLVEAVTEGWPDSQWHPAGPEDDLLWQNTTGLRTTKQLGITPEQDRLLRKAIGI
ncbi:hypothetical protein [Myceligenerans indicum]|uniref:Uncharacterized protein n=1 Tax=Myceligenerans indicum TaxID=2593663 RepID=A0ABS1LLN7_9MICO|nr:hypothetical protein [Myceligenerans indicum]MBL0887170.1 hypothetical protein [Myceligenerans indicum]